MTRTLLRNPLFAVASACWRLFTPTRWRLFTRTCCLLAAPALLPAAAQTTSFVGASVAGTASGAMELSCHTCTNYPIFFSNEADVGQAFAGGPGFASARLDRVAMIDRSATLGSFPDDPNTVGPDYTLGGGAAYAASAEFTGPLATPLLRARAGSDNPRVYLLSLPAEPNAFVGWNYYSAYALASTTQAYTYTGTVPVTYNFQFTLDGVLQDPRASLTGAAYVYKDDPETGARARAEETLATALLAGSETQMRSFSIGMHFQPGETLHLEATFTASAVGNFQFGLPDEGRISADGMSTMWVSGITGGDTALLTPTLAPIPEPASVAMWLLGLGALAGLQRRRVAQPAVAAAAAAAAVADDAASAAAVGRCC